MKNSLRRFLYALLIAIFISGNLFQGISAGPQTDKAAPVVGHNPETGKVSFIGGGAPITIPGASGVRSLSAQDKALVAAELYGPQFGLKTPSQELSPSKSANDGNGHTITRYQQVYQGIPVLGGELIFNMNTNGDLQSVSGEVSSDLSIDTHPAISSTSASQTALGAVAKWHKVDASALALSKPELMIFDESLLKESTRAPRLVWHLEVTAAGQPIREMVLIDAQSGSISLHINQVDTDAETPTPEPAPTATSVPSDQQGKTKGSDKPSQNPSVGAATLYVSSTGNNLNTCLAIIEPCATINGALGKAAAGDTIKVTSETYVYTAPGNPNVVTITKAITLSGGWDGAFTSQSGFSTIDGQSANNGILVNNAGAVLINRFVIQNSLTHSDSGAIYQIGSGLTLQNSTLKSNHGDNHGGGVYLTNSGALTLINSTLSGNSANVAGGGIYIYSGSLTIQNSTIAYNSSAAGGGVGQVSGSIVIHNSILAHNTATSTGPDCSGLIGTSDHNILGTTTGCTVSAGTGDQFNVDPLIDTLGGTPPVHALQTGSPAINAGDNSTCPAVDERGVPRPQQSVCDIGAFEYSLPGAAYAISVSSGSPQTTPATTVFGNLLKALVTDQYGVPVGNVTVTFTGPSSGAGGTFADSSNNITTAMTDNTGIATASVFTANAAIGAYDVDATADGPASPAQFQLQNTAAPSPTTLTVSSGSPQSSLINSAFASPLKALVKDQYNNPMSGITVTFTAPSSGASGIFTDTSTINTSAVTNAGGVATASTFTANGTIGAYTVNATSTGIASPAPFQLTNLGNIKYVSTTGNDSNDCQTPAAPCLTINGALGKAASSGDVIDVASGTYTGTGSYVVTISKSIQIVGGWDATFTNQNGKSIIDGQAARTGIFIFRTGSTGLTVDISQITLQNSSGAAVYVRNTDGNTNLNRVAIINNTGTGIYNYIGGNINLINSTISGNHAGGYAGTAITIAVGTINIQFSTITNNTGSTTAAIYGNTSGLPQVEMGNSILAGNTDADCNGSITSDGHNIFGRSPACTNPITIQPSDQVGVNPQIGPLTAGGYHAISSSSPAVDAANPATCPATDQRGASRPHGSGCDIGAYEYTPAGPAAAISVAGGSGQVVPLNRSLPMPLLAYVGDSDGAPVSGITVTFTAPASGASGIFSGSGTNTTTALTNGAGIAAAPTYTANAVSGTYNITATASGVAGTANFSITNQEFYVSPSGNDSWDCITPATACLTINAALAKAPIGAGIRVASGTYTGTGTYVVTISKSVQIFGGWDAAFTSQNGQSIIDGQTDRSGIYIWGTNLAVDISQIIVQNSNGSAVYDNNTGGTVNFNRVALLNNSANSSYNANGIYNLKGNVNFTNSTISGNHAGGIAGTAVSDPDGHINIQFSTITNNTGGYAIYGLNGSSQIEMGNSILAGNTSGDCWANITSDGHNIFGHLPACNNAITTQSSDQVGADPVLSTMTTGGYHVLLAGSPAINAADTAACPAIDQRGVTRPQGSACDIGAYEYQPGTIPVSVSVFKGSPQYIQPGNTATTNFAVVLADANGAGVPGRTVTFTAPSSGASGVFTGTGTNTTTAVTGFNGLATAAAFTANSTYGSYSIQATVSGLSTPAVFSITNISMADIRTYTMNHGIGTLPGTFVCNLAQPNCTSGPDVDVNHATQYAFDTFLFYKTHFNRNSIDNAGMAIISSVHYGTNYQNAYWNGYQMVYGDGFTADDVVGHELTHGVTDYTSQLIYAYQSGAINESLSDVFGEFVDQTNGSGNDTPGVKWLLGEDIAGGAIRSMSNPPTYGDPDKMTSPNFYIGASDYGGVHTNSGVNNKAAFLMTDGGSFNGKTVTGLGLNKTAAIYYEVQTNLLGAAANYSDLYYAIHQSCLNLAGGSDGITSSDCNQVQDVIDAVEMNIKPSQAYTPNPDACPAGENVISTLFSDDMESGTGKWSFGSIAGGNLWSFQTPGIASPDHSMVGVDLPTIHDSVASMTSDISVPSAGKPMLYFKHYFELDSYYDTNGNLLYAYDGGVVEYSTNHGATWTDAGSLFSAGQNYNGVLSTSFHNPLGGRAAFSGFSDQMVGSRYTLSSLAGRTARFRWREGTDNSYGFTGWYVDDVKVYTCSSVPTSIISGNAGLSDLTLSYTDGTPKTATTDDYGSYSFTVSNNWSGTVIPVNSCYTFSPLNRVYSNVVSNQTAQNYAPAINPGCANINVSIGGKHQGTYGLPSAGSMRMNYSGVDNGPVKVMSTNSVNIIAAMRDAWSTNGVTTSFAQLMGLPASQLSDTYVFPAYNNVTLNEQLRIGNVDSVPTTVTVTIGGVLRGTYPLAANEAVRVNYAGLDSGPVIVQGTAGVHIIAAERDAWSTNGTTTSFVQLMGLPASQLSDTYVFPAYNNVTLNEQLRIANVDSGPSVVTVTIGGVLKGTYPLGASESVRVNYAGLDSGPVIVQGTAGVHIIAAERDAWAANGATYSYAQLMGLPAGQLSDTYEFPAYNNITLNEQLRIGNVDSVPTTVTVTIGGVLKGTYPLAANEAVRVNYAGLDSGPVVVQGTAGVHIIAAERDAWTAGAPYNTTTSFIQLMGLPSGSLSDTFLFPAYNNVTLNEQLRFGVP